jgi:hypothetical protein
MMKEVMVPPRKRHLPLMNRSGRMVDEFEKVIHARILDEILPDDGGENSAEADEVPGETTGSSTSDKYSVETDGEWERKMQFQIKYGNLKDSNKVLEVLDRF